MYRYRYLLYLLTGLVIGFFLLTEEVLYDSTRATKGLDFQYYKQFIVHERIHRSENKIYSIKTNSIQQFAKIGITKNNVTSEIKKNALYYIRSLQLQGNQTLKLSSTNVKYPVVSNSIRKGEKIKLPSVPSGKKQKPEVEINASHISIDIIVNPERDLSTQKVDVGTTFLQVNETDSALAVTEILDVCDAYSGKIVMIPTTSSASQKPNLQISSDVNYSHRNLANTNETHLELDQLLRMMTNSSGCSFLHNPKSRIRVIVSANFRSGSSFLGDIIQQAPSTYYHFEPLHCLDVNERVMPNKEKEAMSLLAKLFNCNFNSFLTKTNESALIDRFRRNNFLWDACSMHEDLCYVPELVCFFCQCASNHLMKITRLSLAQVGRFVINNPELDVRVIHLVRDPRGIFSSRTKLIDWCQGTGCADFRVLCREMMDDYRAFQRLLSLRPGKIIQVRYEDLALRPYEVSKQLIEFVGMKLTDAVREFLRQSTKGSSIDDRDDYSTRRDSAKTPFKWTTKLNQTQIRDIQRTCKEVLFKYEYPMFDKGKRL